MGFISVLSIDSSIRIPTLSRTARVFHAFQDPVGVCKAILLDFERTLS